MHGNYAPCENLYVLSSPEPAHRLLVMPIGRLWYAIESANVSCDREDHGRPEGVRSLHADESVEVTQFT